MNSGLRWLIALTFLWLVSISPLSATTYPLMSGLAIEVTVGFGALVATTVLCWVLLRQIDPRGDGFPGPASKAWAFGFYWLGCLCFPFGFFSAAGRINNDGYLLLTCQPQPGDLLLTLGFLWTGYGLRQGRPWAPRAATLAGLVALALTIIVIGNAPLPADRTAWADALPLTLAGFLAAAIVLYIALLGHLRQLTWDGAEGSTRGFGWAARWLALLTFITLVAPTSEPLPLPPSDAAAEPPSMSPPPEPLPTLEAHGSAQLPPADQRFQRDIILANGSADEALAPEQLVAARRHFSGFQCHDKTLILFHHRERPGKLLASRCYGDGQVTTEFPAMLVWQGQQWRPVRDLDEQGFAYRSGTLTAVSDRNDDGRLELWLEGTLCDCPSPHGDAAREATCACRGTTVVELWANGMAPTSFGSGRRGEPR